MTEEARSDPFALSANPAAYVPRQATEQALESLARALDGGVPLLVLSGPAGLGKTLVLRLLETRLRGRRSLVYVPYAALSAADVCRWALTVLGRPTQGDALAMIARVARDAAARGAPLVLLLDEGSAIPLDTARRLADLTTELAGALSLVVALTDDPKGYAVVAALGSHAQHVRLETPLSAAESSAYVCARLARVNAPDEVRRRFDASLLDRLYRGARGVPRVLHRLASEVVRRGPAALPGIELDEPAFDPAPPPPPTPARIADAPAPPSRTAAEPPPRERPSVPPRVVSAAPPPAARPSPTPPRVEPPPREPQPSRRPQQAALEGSARPAAPAPLPPRPAARTDRAIGPLQVFLVALVIGAAAISIPLLLSRAPAPPPSRGTAPAGPAPALPPKAESPALAPEPIPEPAPEPTPVPPRVVAEPPAVAPAPEPAPAPSVPAPLQPSQSIPKPAVLEPAPPPPPPAPAPTPVSVAINATPWATVEIDGREVGDTPLAGIALTPGSHVFKARMPDGREIIRTVEIDARNRFVTFP